MTSAMTPAGQPFHIMDVMAMLHFFGTLSDGDVPGLQTVTMEGIGDDLVITIPIAKGEKGDDGLPAPAVDMQIDPTVTQPSELPSDLGPDDKGKTWWLGDLLYYWTGTGYITRPAGYPGRPGPVPQISVTTELLPPDATSVVEQSGNALNPHLNFKIAAPRGLTGPSAAIRQATDYDNTVPPNNGQIPTWNETKQKWEPSDFASKHVQAFSIPESAFTNVSQIVNGRVPILSYQLPVFDFAWVPWVTGHFKAFGVDLNILDPFKIGAEVRLGDPNTGQLIGRGKGNTSQETTVVPHFSTPGDPDTAVSPDNGVAQINAGEQATLTVNLVNDGLLGMYSFNRKDAQLGVLVVPQGL